MTEFIACGSKIYGAKLHWQWSIMGELNQQWFRMPLILLRIVQNMLARIVRSRNTDKFVKLS